MKILIFGGAFNPPTLAHQVIIGKCLGLPGFDQVWVMPSGQRLDKSMEASDSDRLEMLRIVKKIHFADNPRLIISDFELRLPRPTQTVMTVKALKSLNAGYDFWFAFGADSYRSMTSWQGGSDLKKNLNVVLFARSPSDTTIGKHAITLGLPDISATRVRHTIKNNQSLGGLTSPEIAKYIKAHGLYKS